MNLPERFNKLPIDLKLVALAAVFLFLAFIAVAASVGFDPEEADESVNRLARKHLTLMAIPFDAVSCTFYDSDGDGYRSCTYSVQGELFPLECSFLACRVPKPGIRLR